MKMFCYQCQETARGKGCEIQGVCGKKPETSARMDQLLYIARGMAIVNRQLREPYCRDRTKCAGCQVGANQTVHTYGVFDGPCSRRRQPSAPARWPGSRPHHRYGRESESGRLSLLLFPGSEKGSFSYGVILSHHKIPVTRHRKNRRGRFSFGSIDRKSVV